MEAQAPQAATPETWMEWFNPLNQKGVKAFILIIMAFTIVVVTLWLFINSDHPMIAVQYAVGATIGYALVNWVIRCPMK